MALTAPWTDRRADSRRPDSDRSARKGGAYASGRPTTLAHDPATGDGQLVLDLCLVGCPHGPASRGPNRLRPSTYLLDNPTSCLVCPTSHLALPHSDHPPTGLGQLAVNALVPRPVRGELRCPPLGVGTLEPSGRVPWASVPETTVNEDRDAWTREHQVRTTPIHQGSSQPVTKSERVNRAAQRDLGPGVPGTSSSQVSALGRGHPTCLGLAPPGKTAAFGAFGVRHRPSTRAGERRWVGFVAGWRRPRTRLEASVMDAPTPARYRGHTELTA